ncbi:MAG: hypothetical protein FWH33_08185, partial [Oscillospiraceae bacterium]|nr:hypothetical protein [Oscillospiraceae bacterium]
MFILSNTMRNLARHGRKSVLYCAICIAAVLAMQVYLAGIDSTEAQLRRLPEAIPISARVTNQIGSRFGGLQIHERIVDGLLASDNVKELLLATQLRAGLGEFAPEESRQRLQFNVMGANTIGALGKRVGDGAEWLSGYSPDFLLGNDAVCLADRGIMEALGLKLGDSIPLNLYYYKHSAMGSSLTFAPLELLQFRIVAVADLGIVSADMAAPSLVIPIETHSDICHRQGVDFTAASASFFVRDALLLNEFKAEMKA